MRPTTEDWPRVRDAFERALELADDERIEFLDQEFEPGDPLRRQVEGMLRAEEREDREAFLEPPTLTSVEQAGIARQEGRQVASFTIRRLIAAGGMGAVYEAEQQDPKRRVALKMLRNEFANEDARRRFRDEIDLLARLKHPGIAQIYEAGTITESAGEPQMPWFAMELVDGGRSVVRYALEEGLELRERLELVRAICDAVHHGHQRGVIHRDLKPANLLVDATGRPKVIDFGVAKATDHNAEARTRQTQSGDLVGTLLYMSPEQIRGTSDEVDVRTDVYALGVVLYELLSGKAPFDLSKLSITEAGRVLAEKDPSPPSSLSDVPRELDWVVGKALAKERERRYQSVLKLSEDLGRFLEHHPVTAGPPSGIYQLKKFVRRHRVGVGASALVLLALTLGVIGIAVGLVRAKEAEAKAKEDREIAVRLGKEAQDERNAALDEAQKATEVVEFLVDVLSSPDPSRDGRDVRVVDVLDEAAATYEERFASRPFVSARLASAIGVVYHGLGMDDEALVELEASLETLRSEEGEPTTARARVLRELGVVRLDSGDIVGAKDAFDEAFEVQEELGIVEGAHIHRAHSQMGLVRLQEDKLGEAEALLLSALKGLGRTLGEEHRETLLTANALAGVYHKLGRLEEAETYYRTSLEGLERVLGATHPDVVTAQSNLAVLFNHLGRSEEAIPLLEKLLEVRRETLGADHPDTLGSISNLAGLLHLAGRLDEAAELYEDGLEQMERLLPDEHPALQVLRSNLAILERDRGGFERAEALLGAVYNTRKATLGEDHPRTLSTLYDMARVARMAAQFELAHERATRGLEAARANPEIGQPFQYQYELEVGLILAELERFEESEEVLLATWKTYEESIPFAPLLQSPDTWLAELYERWGKPEKAKKHRAAADAQKPNTRR